LRRLIRKSYEFAGAGVFFTWAKMMPRLGPSGHPCPEARALSIADLEKHFIRAETIHWEYSAQRRL